MTATEWRKGRKMRLRGRINVGETVRGEGDISNKWP